MKTKAIIIGSLLMISLTATLSCKKDKKEEVKEPTPQPTLADYNQYLVSNYYFNNTLVDSSISNVSLINNGGATFVNDRNSNSNSAINFDGNNDYLEFTNSSHVKMSFPFTVSMWVYLDENISFNNRLFVSDPITPPYSGYNILCGGATPGIISAGYGNGNGVGTNFRKTFYSTDTIAAQEWHHVAVVFKSISEIQIFIDGAKQITTSDGGSVTMAYSNYQSNIGRFGASNLNGSIDNLKIWSKNLPANVIIEEFQSNL